MMWKGLDQANPVSALISGMISSHFVFTFYNSQILSCIVEMMTLPFKMSVRIKRNIVSKAVDSQ